MYVGILPTQQQVCWSTKWVKRPDCSFWAHINKLCHPESTKGVAPTVSSEGKEKGVLVSLKLKALPWLANVWQKARHWDTKEESISAVIFTCSSQLRKLQKDQRSCHQNPDDYNNIFDASCLAKDLGNNIELKRFFSISITTDYFHEANHKRCSKSFKTSEYMKLMNINSEACEQTNSALQKITSSTTFMSQSMYLRSLTPFLADMNISNHKKK